VTECVLSGNIALVYKVLFGIHYNENSLQFKPFVPKALAGERSLKHFKYRNAVLNISMTGYGNLAKSITLDGRAVQDGIIPVGLEGEHMVKIVLANNTIAGKSNMVPGYTAAETPVVAYQKGKLLWSRTQGAAAYNVIKNGKKIASVKALAYAVPATRYAEYQVAAVDVKGITSFNSKPVDVTPAKAIAIIQAESIANRSESPGQGFSGDGFVEISKTKNPDLTFSIAIKEDGLYTVDFRYANGNGPINTENKCAIRTLAVDNHFTGTVVFPQRGKGEWSNWGFSNSVKVKLTKGKHALALQFKNANENMNGDINQAMIDYLRVIKL
jgi:hypothetical protein